MHFLHYMGVTITYRGHNDGYNNPVCDTHRTWVCTIHQSARYSAKYRDFTSLVFFGKSSNTFSKALEKSTHHLDAKLHGGSYLEPRRTVADRMPLLRARVPFLWLHPNPSVHMHSPRHSSHASLPITILHFSPLAIPSQATTHLHGLLSPPGNSLPTCLPHKPILQVSASTPPPLPELPLFPGGSQMHLLTGAQAHSSTTAVLSFTQQLLLTPFHVPHTPLG